MSQGTCIWYVNNDADQPDMNVVSVIATTVVLCKDRVTPVVAVSKIQSLLQGSVAE